MMSVGQESRSSLAGWFWLRFSPKVVVRGQLGLQSSEGPTRARRFAPKWLIHTAESSYLSSDVLGGLPQHESLR